MAQHKSADKRNRQNTQRAERNSALRARMRRSVRAARAAIADNSPEKATIVANAVREVQRSKSKNIIKAKTASRYVSRLMKAAQA